MSYVSTNATLNIGDANSSTVNINTSSTLNLGGSSNVNINSSLGNVNITSGSGVRGVSINGVPLILSSATGVFASLSSLDNINYTYSSNYYLLPYTTTQNFMIQWGCIPNPGSGNLSYTTFPVKFASIPYVFAQQYSTQGGQNNNIYVSGVSTTDVTIDSAYNGSKYPIT